MVPAILVNTGSGHDLCPVGNVDLSWSWSQLRRRVTIFAQVIDFFELKATKSHGTHGLYSLSGWTSYCEISGNLEAARLGVIMTVSLWHLTGISRALLPRCLSNVRAIWRVKIGYRGFEASQNVIDKIIQNAQVNIFLYRHIWIKVGNNMLEAGYWFHALIQRRSIIKVLEW